MNTLDDEAVQSLTKIACQKLSEEKGSKVAAAFAGVSEGRWSHYASLDHMDKHLPLWRALMIQQRSGREDFAKLFTQVGAVGGEVTCHPQTITGNCLMLIATMTTALNEALEDDQITENERRELLKIADRLCDEGARLKARLSTNVRQLKGA